MAGTPSARPATRPAVATASSTITSANSIARRTLLPEHLPTRRLDDGEDGRVLDPSLDRDGVEACRHRVDPTDGRDAGLLPGLLLDRRGRGEDAQTGPPEHVQQGAVLELACHEGANALRVEPLVERSPERRVVGREQQGGTGEGAREPAAVGPREAARAEERQTTLAEQVVEGADPDGRREGRVGEDQVEPVDRELRQQALGLVLATDDAHGLAELERRLQETIRDQLGHDVGDPDREAERATRWPVLEGVEQLAAEREDLVREAEGDAAGVGEREVAPDAGEELLAEGRLQRPDLRADRRLPEPQLHGGAGDAALARHDPEVEEVVVVEPLHRREDRISTFSARHARIIYLPCRRATRMRAPVRGERTRRRGGDVTGLTGIGTPALWIAFTAFVLGLL